MRKIYILLIGILMFIIYINSASAIIDSDLTPHIVGYFTMDDYNDSSDVGNNLSDISGREPAKATGCKFDDCYNFDGSNDALRLSYNKFYDYNSFGEFMVTAWVNSTTNGVYQVILAQPHSSSDWDFKMMARSGGHDNKVWYASDGDFGGDLLSDSAYTGDGNFHFLAWVWNGTHGTLYVDGVLQSIQLADASLVDPGTDDLGIGCYTYNNQCYKGAIDDLIIWNSTSAGGTESTQAIIDYMYNSGTGRTLSYGSPPPSLDPALLEYEFTAVDLYSGSALNNISVNITNSSFHFSESTTNGTLRVNNQSVGSFNVSYDIKIKVNDTGGYYDITYSDLNLTEGGDLEAKLYQAILYVNITEATTGTGVTDFNITTGDQLNKSNSSGYAKMLLSSGTYDLTAHPGGAYLPSRDNVTLTALTENYLTIEVGTANLTIKAYADSQLLTFNTSYKILVSGYTKSESTNNGVVVFPIIAGTYNVSVNASGYTTDHEVITITASNQLPNVTFNLYTTNSMNISIYDEELNELITSATTTIVLDHSEQKVENTTTDGTLFFSGMLTGLWNLLASTPYHYQREYIFTLTSQSIANINVYLLNSSNGELKTFTIKNEEDQSLTDATFIVTNKVNNSYVTIAHLETDFSGQASVFLRSDNRYRFTISAEGYDTKVFDLIPTASSYIIVMGAESVVTFTTIFDKFDYTIIPESTILTRSESQNISLITTSDLGYIDYFGLNTSFNNVDLLTNVSGSLGGGTASILVNISEVNLSGSIVSVDFFIKVSNEDLIRIHKDYYISSVLVPSNYSAQGFTEKYEGSFSAVVKALLVVLVAIGLIITLLEVGVPATISGAVGSFVIIVGAIINYIPRWIGFIIAITLFLMFIVRRGD